MSRFALETIRLLSPASLALLLASSGCGAPDPPGSTGGTDLPPGQCGRGLVAVATDYQSTNVALVGLDGEVLSSSFISSATTAAELTAPLSGDVAVPTMATTTDEIVLLDRYPASVLTWVAVADGSVRAQLNVSTGFAANPQDYADLGAGRAYVTRYEQNPTPGQEPFDAGSDLLVVDVTAPAIAGRIDLGTALEPDEAGFEPHPNRIAVVGRWAFVLVAAYSAGYLSSAPSRIVTIDSATDQVASVTRLDGLHGCAGLMASADGSRLAVTCSGDFAGTATPNIDSSAALLLSVAPGADDQTPPALTELARAYAAGVTAAPFGFTVDFATDDRLLLTTMGRFDPSGSPDLPDALLELDPFTAEHRVLRTTESLPFELGEARCLQPCAGCFAADAERGVVTRLLPGPDGWLTIDRDVVVDTAIGLPPRGLGRF